MDKRLPLTLFLCALVMVGWMLIFPTPQKHKTVPAPGSTGSSARADGERSTDGSVPQLSAQSGSTPAAGPERILLEAPEAAAEERTETLLLGQSGEPGYWRAVFSNRGARLVELTFGDFMSRVGLSAEERAEHANWARLLMPTPLPGGGFSGSLLLSTSTSSAELATEALELALWNMRVLEDAQGRSTGVEWSYAPGTGVRFVKRLERIPGTFEFGLTLTIENRGVLAGPRQFVFTPAGVVPEEIGDKFTPEPSAVAVGPASGPPDSLRLEDLSIEVVQRSPRGGENYGPLEVGAPLVLAGVENKYFACLMRAADEHAQPTLTGARYLRVAGPSPVLNASDMSPSAKRFLVTEVDLTLNVPPVGESASWSYRIYAGPKDNEHFVADYAPHKLVLDKGLGFFAGIAKFLLAFLRLCHLLVGNWGWAIILLTFCVRLVLFPINRRSQTAMARYAKKMKRVQPKLEEIKKKYEKDPQRLRQEQARLMQEEGAFPPLGGCLPVFLQLPVFFGLFSALRTSFDLRQEPFFGWIQDLSRPDQMFALGWDIPLLITKVHLAHFNLLPILMVVLWLAQQMTMPKPSDEQAARMQKMMMFMPVVMGFFLYDYAAGLSLYMITQSTVGILEQTVIKKVWPLDDRELPKGEKSGCGPFAGTMKKIADMQRKEVERRQRLQGKSR